MPKIGVVNLTITRGKYFDKLIKLRLRSTGAAVDLTGSTIQAQVRKGRSKTTDLILSFTCTHNDAGGDITIAYDDTSYTLASARGYWSLIIIDSLGNPRPYLIGEVTIEDDPTEVV